MWCGPRFPGHLTAVPQHLPQPTRPTIRMEWKAMPLQSGIFRVSTYSNARRAPQLDSLPIRLPCKLIVQVVLLPRSRTTTLVAAAPPAAAITPLFASTVGRLPRGKVAALTRKWERKWGALCTIPFLLFPPGMLSWLGDKLRAYCSATMWRRPWMIVNVTFWHYGISIRSTRSPWKRWSLIQAQWSRLFVAAAAKKSNEFWTKLIVSFCSQIIRKAEGWTFERGRFRHLNI